MDLLSTNFNALFMNVTPRSFGTHDGSFHADEVTACALLVYFRLIDLSKIVRSRQDSELNHCEYVCDVGGLYDPSQKRFDHHQIEYTGEMSSAGMVLKYLKDQKVITEAAYEHINRSLVLGVDSHDNGKVPSDLGFCSFSNIISNFMPIEYDAAKEALDAAFLEALSFAVGHIKRLYERFLYVQSCHKEVELAMQQGKEVLIFDKPLPWTDTFFELGGENHPALFVIMPSGSAWKLRGVPPTNHERMKVRLPQPQEWAGLLTQELKKVTGIPGAVFCHKGRFISVWETKADAEKALELILTRRKL